VRVVAGERAVHISMTYEDADRILLSTSSSGWTVMRELERKIRPALEHGKKHGYPLPPLPKSNVAHDSDVEIVPDHDCVGQKACPVPGCPEYAR